MMRRWHRYLSILAGLFLLWISATGVLGQVGAYVNRSAAAQAPPAAAPPGFTCPETMTCRPKPRPGAWNVGAIHHLHSGESFGLVGQLVSTLCGLALFFFAISGLTMYVQLYRGRLARVRDGKARGRFFWK